MAKQKITIEWEGNNINCSFSIYSGTGSTEIIGVLEFVKQDILLNKPFSATKEEKDNEVPSSQENLR